VQNSRGFGLQEEAKFAGLSCRWMKCNILKLKGRIIDLDLIELRRRCLAPRRSHEEVDQGFPWKLQD